MVKLTPAEHIQQQLFWYGWYEKKYISTWESMIRKDLVVVDIGANIGYYAMTAARKGARVYALEPAGDHFQQLRENMALNHLDNIEIFKLAASDQKALVHFYRSGSENTGMSGLSQPSSFNGQTEEVQTVLLDDLVKEIGINRIDLVKMDIEGAELHALKGMSYLLEKMKPVLFVEVDAVLLRRFNQTVDDLYKFLSSFGYRAYRVKQANNLIPADSGLEDELVVFSTDEEKLAGFL